MGREGRSCAFESFLGFKASWVCCSGPGKTRRLIASRIGSWLFFGFSHHHNNLKFCLLEIYEPGALRAEVIISLLQIPIPMCVTQFLSGPAKSIKACVCHAWFEREIFLCSNMCLLRDASSVSLDLSCPYWISPFKRFEFNFFWCILHWHLSGGSFLEHQCYASAKQRNKYLAVQLSAVGFHWRTWHG